MESSNDSGSVAADTIKDGDSLVIKRADVENAWYKEAMSIIDSLICCIEIYGKPLPVLTAFIYTKMCAKKGQNLDNFKALVRSGSYAGKDRRNEYRPKLH